MRLTSLICIALAVITLSACGRHKTAPAVDVAGEYALMADYYAELADSGELDSAWHDAFLPFKLNLYAPAQVSLSGRATLVRDSAIHLSIRMLGIEGAVVLITTDSVFVHDKYHNIYIADALGEQLSGIGLSNIQAALTGKPFAPGPQLDSICWVLPSANGQIESLSIDLPAEAQAYCAYSQWASTDYGPLAGLCDLLVFASPISEEASAQASVEWNWGSAKFDSGREIKFKAPADLPAVRISDIGSMLKDMQ